MTDEETQEATKRILLPIHPSEDKLYSLILVCLAQFQSNPPYQARRNIGQRSNQI